jgi:hypothetical protein
MNDMRQFGSGTPAQQSMVQGQMADRNSAGIKRIRGMRNTQPGNSLPRQIRIAQSVRMELTPADRALFEYDYDAPYATKTFYLHDSFYFPWTEDPLGKIPAVPFGTGAKLEWLTTLLPEFVGPLFIASSDDAGSISRSIIIELLDVDGAVIKHAAFWAQTHTNSTAQHHQTINSWTFDANGPIERFWAIRLTWNVSGDIDSSSTEKPIVGLTWYMPEVPNVNGPGGGEYQHIYLTEHTIPGLTDNIWTIGDADAATAIVYAGPGGALFPWHKQNWRGRPLMAAPSLYFDTNDQSDTDGIGSIFDFWTVDKFGADVEQLFNTIGGTDLRNNRMGVAVTSFTRQTLPAAGFRLKTKAGFVSTSNTWNLFNPMRIFWDVIDVAP